MQTLSPDTDRRLVHALISRRIADPVVVAKLAEEHEHQRASGVTTSSLAQLLCTRGVVDRTVAAHLLRAVRAERQLEVTLGSSRGPAATEPDLPRQIAHYEILGVLGKGGMGVVYRAFDTRIRRPVALKMILDPSRVDPDELERFGREARSAGRVSHPGIVQVYEAGVHDRRPYIAMELVEGQSFEALLKGPEPVPPRRTAEIVQGVAEALHHAHERGVIHRDVKPHNVLVDAAGRPHLADFGLARDTTASLNLTTTGTVIGTPAYLAPEQARGDAREQGPHTDVYALGAVLYRALVGRPPFEALNVNALLLKVCQDEPVPPRRERPQLHADLETITLRCLAKEPGRRYPSAAAVAADLKRFLDGEAILGRPVGRLERLRRRVLGNPIAATLVALAVLLAPLASWLALRHLAARDQRILAEQRTQLLVAARDRVRADLAALERDIEPIGENPGETRPVGFLYDVILRIVDLGERCVALPLAAPEGARDWDAAALRDRARALACRAARVARAVDDFPIVARALQVAHRVHPDDAPLARELATVERVATPEAHLAFWTALETGKRAWMRSRDAAEAREALHRAATLNPLAIGPWQGLATMSIELRQLDRALDELEQGLAAAPDAAVHYFLRGKVRVERRELDAACEDVSRAVELMPSSLEMRIVLIENLCACERFAEARKHVDALEDSPRLKEWRDGRSTYGQYRFLRGMVLMKTDDPARAEEAFEEALALIPRERRLIAWRGLARAARGAHEAARADLRSYLGAPDPQDPPLLEVVRRALERLR